MFLGISLVVHVLAIIIHQKNILLYWYCFQVLHLHIFLAIQDLLCVWFHAASVCHHDSGHRLCHNCLHILPTQLWGLSMVSCCSPHDHDVIQVAVHTTTVITGTLLSVNWISSLHDTIMCFFSPCFRQWTSFCAGGSISVYVYLYSFYYFLFKTK